MFDDILDLRGILGDDRPLCAECKEDGKRIRMEESIEFSPKLACEVTAWVCPEEECGHMVMRDAGRGEGPEMVDRYGSSTEWRDVSPRRRGGRR